MKKIHLTIHIFPREIDDYEFTINQLKFASQFISNLQIDANVILNVNPEIINWENSKLSKEYFIDKFKHINKKLDWVNNLNEEISEEYFGYLEKRISNTQLQGYNAFWWQDVDLILDDLLFYGIEYGLNNITDSKFILSPQCFKFWDHTWDVISHSPEQNINVDEFDSFLLKKHHYNRDQVLLVKNFEIKFAGGWSTIISNDLIKETPFPIQLKGYGREDTFLATWVAKHRYPQYILKNIIIQENRKYLSNLLYSNYVNYNDEYLKNINNKSLEQYYSMINSL